MSYQSLITFIPLTHRGDIDGDGRADAIWVHPQDGSAVVWLNKDPSKRSGWVRSVPYPRSVIPGTGVAGANVRFARVHVAHGRADYIEVDPGNGAITVWGNGCNRLAPAPASSGDSDGSKHQPAASVVACGVSSGDSPTPAPTEPVPMNAVLLTFEGSTYTANSATQLVIAGQTLTPGGEITVAGTPISLGHGGSVAVVGGSTESLAHAAAGLAPVLTFAGSTYTENSASQLVVAGQTLTPGGQITVSGTLISLAPDASLAVAAGVTQALGPASTSPGKLPVLSIGESRYTANSASAFVIGGQTLTQGGGLTVSGTPISLAPGGSLAIVAGITESSIFDFPTTIFPSKSPTLNPARMSSSSESGGGLTIPGFTTIASPTEPEGSFPTAGSAAINALKPLASSALDAIHDAQTAVTYLTQNHAPSSGDLSYIGDLLSNAFKDVGSLGVAAENIELQSFTGEDLQGVTQMKSGFGNLLKLIRDVSDGFAPYFFSAARGVSQYPKLATQLVAIDLTALILVVNWHRYPASTTTSSAASSSNTGTPSEWILNTVPGTSIDAFEKFIGSLPDKGAGRRIIYPHLPDQGYVGKMTLAEAQDVSRNPIVDQITPNSHQLIWGRVGQQADSMNQSYENFAKADSLPNKKRRSNALEQHRSSPRQNQNGFTVMRRDQTAPLHLKLLSLFKNKNIHDEAVNTEGYLYEQSGGAGSFIYVIDTGLEEVHAEFGHLPIDIESYTAQAPYTMPNVDLGAALEDTVGHGTWVSSMIVGTINGVVQKTNLVVIKIADSKYPESSPELMYDGWRWAINDIISKGRGGKAVINMSFGKPSPLCSMSAKMVNFMVYTAGLDKLTKLAMGFQ